VISPGDLVVSQQGARTPLWMYVDLHVGEIKFEDVCLVLACVDTFALVLTKNGVIGWTKQIWLEPCSNNDDSYK
jgi:hypothetical protein